MAYLDGFIAAVPSANKEAYRKHAADSVPLFREFGAVRQVEAWGDDVSRGELTDMWRAVKATPEEIVVFSWIEYPDKATRDAAIARMMEDPRMEEMGASMPFDSARIIYGGFAPIHDVGPRGTPGYIDGSLLPVPASAEAAYRELARVQSAVLLEYGALRVVDAWGTDVPRGELTDMWGAVDAKPDEIVVFDRIEWPSKAVRDEAWRKVFADPRMHAVEMPFDQQRRIFGGFVPLVDA